MIANVGGDGKKLVDATVVELSGDEDTRTRQINYNLNLIRQADGLLAPPTGKERFLSVATSHTTAGRRAVHAKCRSPCKKLVDSEGHLSYEIASKRDPVYKDMLDRGWVFMCIPWQVEKLWPILPHIAQAELNASNNVASLASELEIASLFASCVGEADGNEVEWAVAEAAANEGSPPCSDYIPCIVKLFKRYGGGLGSPCITFPDHISKHFGAEETIGKELMEAVTNLDIPSEKTTYPLVRIAGIATNLASFKQVDGLARFILPST